jgi:hypothetical protein
LVQVRVLVDNHIELYLGHLLSKLGAWLKLRLVPGKSLLKKVLRLLAASEAFAVVVKDNPGFLPKPGRLWQYDHFSWHCNRTTLNSYTWFSHIFDCLYFLRDYLYLRLLNFQLKFFL